MMCVEEKEKEKEESGWYWGAFVMAREVWEGCVCVMVCVFDVFDVIVFGEFVFVFGGYVLMHFDSHAHQHTS